MDIKVLKQNREIRDQGAITQKVTFKDVGKSYDFMRIAEGFRIKHVNISVDEAFAKADNTIEVGIEGDTARFIPATAINGIKSINMDTNQFTAKSVTSIVLDVKGTASATGEAYVTVEYFKLPSVRQEM